ncbi:TPA: hypothetical protein RG728_000435 [Morganella morganii subsp. morganii]|uniref:Invasion protein OrgB n=1 Tax=Morganella morganii TaxID=582 RepID=A0AAU8ZKZ8_MORMO|nr:hypothetical protein [Morganella morganii]HDU8691390.1 hypothetical protein [Morganella morganii subsp. morganii]AWC93679.1 hypothetical protein AM380_08585 [Morganella morganii]EKW8486209.1 hypothetical protein [Morganella morganii]HAT3626751.1 hypothetical protein [Morganella morganii]HCU0879417.1 hypothetical protein [Morganella morganii]
MCRSLPDSLLSHIRHGVLIKHRHVSALCRLSNLTRQANQHAARLIKQAEDTSEQHRRAGFDAGFQQGLAQVMPELMRVMNEYKTIIHQNLASAISGLEKELTVFFDDTGIRFRLIHQLVEQFAAECECELILPAELKKEMTEYPDFTVPVSFHSSRNIILRTGKKLLYLTPETFAREKTTQIKARVVPDSPADISGEYL